MANDLWLIWKHPKTRRRYKIGTLSYINNKYIFRYINPELNDALKVGYINYPGFDNIHKIYESNELFANIETRLPNIKRPDYIEILNSYGLNEKSTKFEILMATKGRLITDNYEFVPAFNSNQIEFDVAGTRHSNDIKKIKKMININDQIVLVLDNKNKFDKNAIKIYLIKDNDKYHIGFVPRFYTKELTQLLKNNISYNARIKCVNFESLINDENITVCVRLILSNEVR